MGETVNLAFLTLEWVESHAPSGIGSPRVMLKDIADVSEGVKAKVNFLGIKRPVDVCEIVPSGKQKATK